MEEIDEMRNGIIINTLTSIDFVELVNCGGNILEVFDGFFCHNLECNPYTDFVTDMSEKKRFVQITKKRFTLKSSYKDWSISLRW